MTKHRAYLVCTTGGSNKHYFVGITSTSTDYLTDYFLATAYGSRKPHAHLAQNVVPVTTLVRAVSVFNRIVRSKVARGYVQITRWEDIPSDAPAWFIDGEVSALRAAGPSPSHKVGTGDALVAAAEEAAAEEEVPKTKTLSETRDGYVFWRQCLRAADDIQWFAVIWKDGCWQFFEAVGSNKGYWRQGRASTGAPFADCNDVMRYGNTCVKNKLANGYTRVSSLEFDAWGDEMKPLPLRADWKDPSVKVSLKPTKPVLRNVPTPRFVLKRKEV